ncbi:uncharacterized protein GGS22DRAFT_161508 [Annulohypoxylon maeteangense]|uniref:uncharacterized protein n=1 Tax=Annulohypoxylon maeteangense TaxID=1927788 RepID=UPI00200805CF|nr:uncharacterized protein GGS22DRAFT_161508 [Annulohypoxylon maeteangense]KAI0885648.1 hypothetical protein GGS22DRAFT_161508 [Annulohypoxylon maeteangense]
MDYQHYTYSENMQFPLYVDSPLTDASVDGSVDQGLKPSESSPWAPQMRRYLSEINKSAQVGYQMAGPAFTEAVTRRNDGVAPLPSSLLQRRDSPSFSHTSSTCSSMLSPQGELDYYQANSPSTPPDTTLMSPFFAHYETTNCRAQLYQFTGLADDCVKPIDINPYQETPESFCDDGNPRAEFPSRGYSMSSDDSGVHTDMCCRREKTEVAQPMSPDEFTPIVKEEIRIPESIETYPAFESEDEMTSSEEAPHLDVKREEAEDDEYKPNQRQKRVKPSVSRYTRNRKRHSSSASCSELKRPKMEFGSSNTISRSSTKPMIQGAKGSFSCTECSKKVFFKDENGLQNHIKKQHTRPFVCVFGFAGCNSTFASKNEWKRHCSSQHLVLNYWICQQDQCSKTSSKSSPARNRSTAHCPQYSSLTSIPRGTIFNRKDLYTQHLRRMHIPPNLKKQVKQRKPAPEWELRERTHQDEAKRTRCNLPIHMRCPAFGCGARFDGPNAWDDRMEHVAKHLEKAVTGSEQPIEFGGEHDNTLIDWATRADIAIIERGDKGKWRLRNPLKPSNSPTAGMNTSAEGDEDAEGEEVDE